jgi:serine/threonine protein kinase
MVVKIVKNCISSNNNTRRNEIEAIKNIKNLYIPQIFDYISENDYSYTIMEYIEGKSFDKLLKSGMRFSEEQIKKWYYQLASALTAIHKQDVCHRDIKPSNIMLTNKDDVCLIDFNSALVSGNDTGMISRSMGYASPEQYKYFRMCKDAHINAAMKHSYNIETILLSSGCKTELVSGTTNENRSSKSESEYHNNSTDSLCFSEFIDWKVSDIYSLGATMLHFLTGKRPPVKTDDISKITSIKGFSTDILDIIEKSMRKNPNDRFSSSEELSNALQMI